MHPCRLPIRRITAPDGSCFGSVSKGRWIWILLTKGVERQTKDGVLRGAENRSLSADQSWLLLNRGATCCAPTVHLSRGLGDCDFGAEVNVLDGVEKLDAFLHWALEGFAAGD